MNREKMLQMLSEVEQQREKYRLGSGPEEVKKQHKKGKLTARERAERLFDPGTFHELDLWSFPLKTFFEIDERFSPGDAVVIGYGKIDGRTVMTYAHDFTILAGTQSTVQHAKVTKVVETAIKMGVPYVGILDSAGIRVQDMMGEPGPRPPADGSGLHGSGSFMYSPTHASGVVPQIALMLGPQFAGASYSPILKDFLIMRQGPAYMALVSPTVIKEVTGAQVTYEEIGSAMVHAGVSGTCDLVVESDEEGLDRCRKLLSYLPSNWKEKPPFIDLGDDPERREDELLDLVPLDSSQGYDMHHLISLVVDGGEFFEIKPLYAQNVITGFARLAGQSVGIVASNPAVLNGAVDMNSSDKEARFIRFCDAFNIPLVFLADTIGYLPDLEQERAGVERHAAKVMYAICEATVPKITVYLRNCSGNGELAMGTEQMGVDLVLAWPAARIGMIDPELAVNVIYEREIKTAANPEEVKMSKIENFIKEYNNLYHAGARGLFQDIIDPRETRPFLTKALGWFAGKKEDRPWRKHGNIPL